MPASYHIVGSRDVAVDAAQVAARKDIAARHGAEFESGDCWSCYSVRVERQDDHARLDSIAAALREEEATLADGIPPW